MHEKVLFQLENLKVFDYSEYYNCCVAIAAQSLLFICWMIEAMYNNHGMAEAIILTEERCGGHGQGAQQGAWRALLLDGQCHWALANTQ